MNNGSVSTSMDPPSGAVAYEGDSGSHHRRMACRFFDADSSGEYRTERDSKP